MILAIAMGDGFGAHRIVTGELAEHCRKLLDVPHWQDRLRRLAEQHALVVAECLF